MESKISSPRVACSLSRAWSSWTNWPRRRSHVLLDKPATRHDASHEASPLLTREPSPALFPCCQSERSPRPPWPWPPPHDEPPSELAPTSTNPPGALPTYYGTSPNCQSAAPATSLPEQNPPPPPRPPARRAPFPGSLPPKPTLGMGRSRLADAHRPTHRRPPSPEHRCTPRRAPPLTAPAIGASPITSDPDRAHHQNP